MTTTPVTDRQLAHWRAIRPRSLAIQQFTAQWVEECGCKPTYTDIGRALGLSSGTVYSLAHYTPVTRRKKKSPANHYGRHIKEVTRPPVRINDRRLAQALALLG